MQPREKLSEALDCARNNPAGYLPSPADTLYSGEFFRSLIEGFPDAILVVNPAFRILASNRKAQQLLATKNAIGKSVFDFLEIPQAGQLAQASARSIEEGPVSLECRLLSANGMQFRSLWRLSAIMDGDREAQAQFV